MMTAVWRTMGVFFAGVALGAVSVVQVIPNGISGGGPGGADPELSQALSDLGVTDDTGGGTGVASGDVGADGSSVAVGPQGASDGTNSFGGSGSTDGTGTDGTGSADGTNTTGGSSGDNGSSGDETDDTTGGPNQQQSQGVACEPGRNGGATARGVDGDSIFMATTTVDSGIGAAFLGDVKFAIEAVRQKVNGQGGICGRQLNIEYRDDEWKAQRGAQFLRNFINQGVFAIPVGPSSEGLNVVINSGDFDANKVAVVGTDGLIVSQYQRPDGTAQPWVWPVAVATVSSARIMAQAGYQEIKAATGAEPQASDFSVVFDRDYRFGREGALAYNAEVKRLTGENIPGFNEDLNCRQAFCGIDAGGGQYQDQVIEWRDHRGRFTALFLEPQTALAWMGDPNSPPADEHRYDAAQPLFTFNFGDRCGTNCDDMRVWTGFKPNRGSHRGDAAMDEYIRDVQAINPNADVENQFVVGGYVGMQLLVEALRTVGPTLTRDRFKQALDGASLTTGLTVTETLEFSAGDRYVARSMQGWVMQNEGTFGGWREGPVVEDPRPNAGIG